LANADIGIARDVLAGALTERGVAVPKVIACQSKEPNGCVVVAYRVVTERLIPNRSIVGGLIGCQR